MHQQEVAVLSWSLSPQVHGIPTSCNQTGSLLDDLDFWQQEEPWMKERRGCIHICMSFFVFLFTCFACSCLLLRVLCLLFAFLASLLRLLRASQFCSPFLCHLVAFLVPRGAQEARTQPTWTPENPIFYCFLMCFLGYRLLRVYDPCSDLPGSLLSPSWHSQM